MMYPRHPGCYLFAATASTRSGVRTLDDVLRLGCFCGPSRGRSAGFLPSCSAVSHLAMLSSGTSTAGKAMTPRPTGTRTHDPLLQTALRRPLNKLMTRITSPTTRSKWIRAPPMCKLKPNSHKISRTTKIVQSKLNLMKPLVSLANDFTTEFLISPISSLVRKARFGHASKQCSWFTPPRSEFAPHQWAPDECVRGYVRLFCGGGFLGEHFADAADLRADAF